MRASSDAVLLMYYESDQHQRTRLRTRLIPMCRINYRVFILPMRLSFLFTKERKIGKWFFILIILCRDQCSEVRKKVCMLQKIAIIFLLY